MKFDFEIRASDSSMIETIWRTHSEQAGTFTSQAASHAELVITRHQGTTTLTIRGPETKTSPADYPTGAEFFGIVFKLGTFMPHLPMKNLLNRQDAKLPLINKQSFWLHDTIWQLPDFENADTFVDRLVKNDLLVHDPIVDAVLQNRPVDLSLRTVQRRFLQATGLTRGTVEQIERARQAADLLTQGTSIADAIYQVGYADQPHLTRSLKRFMGQTPKEILHTGDAA